MANFPPLKNHLIFCLERMIHRHDLSAPFLDVGCGGGDIAAFLSAQGWWGKAIDISEQAAGEAHKRLENSRVSVACESVFEERGEYATVLAMDILEHIDRDEAFLRKIAGLLSSHGKLVVAVPSHAREWRWDDDFYGHVRRYSQADLKRLLERAGFELILCWDFTFPFFWLMRRIYTFLICPPQVQEKSLAVRTQQSSLRNSWPGSKMFGSIFRSKWIWRPIFWIQYHMFRHFVGCGHEMLVLAEKK